MPLASILLLFMLLLGHSGAGLHRLGFIWHNLATMSCGCDLVSCIVVLRAAFQLIASCQERQLQRFEYNEREAKFAVVRKELSSFFLSQVDWHLVDSKAWGSAISMLSVLCGRWEMATMN